MRLMLFNPRAEHVLGKQMVVADTLSRSPCKLEQEPDTVENVQAFVELVESTRPATGDQLKRIREGFPARESDGVHIRRVPNTCGRSSLQIREFFDSRGHLSMSNGLFTYDDRIVIPADMREEIRSAFTQVTRVSHSAVKMITFPCGVRVFLKRSRQRWSHANSVRKTNHHKERNH